MSRVGAEIISLFEDFLKAGANREKSVFSKSGIL
jgi:hypothetical protein